MRSRIRLTSAALLAGAVVAVVGTAHTAGAQSCPHAVVFTLPGVTWRAILDARPPEILAAARDAALGSVSVRTNAARTSYASGYATLGAGARVDAPAFAGAPSAEASHLRGRLLQRGVVAAGVAEMERLADEAGYGARPGALASALRAPVVAVGNSDSGDPSPFPAALRRWALLSAMDTSGRVDLSATGPAMLRRTPGAPFGVSSDLAAQREAVDRALQIPCSVVIVDPGDLGRVDAALAAPPEGYDESFDRSWALRRADELFGHIRNALDAGRDLLIAVAPTSPLVARQVHLGVALALGERFPQGTALSSAATRRPGLVTLPDVAPTVVEYMGEQRPPSMIGRPWFARSTDVPLSADDAAALDNETMFVDRLKSPTATVFIVAQVLVYAALLPFIARRDGPRAGARAAHIAALAFVAFPASTYLIGILPAHRLGVGGFILVLLAIDAALVAGASALSSSAVARLLALGGFTFALLVTDLLVSAPLQLNTVLGYSPTVAGRFAGIGNIAFAVLGISALLTGALLVHVGSGGRTLLIAAALLYVVAVVVDGAPQLGGDVGGTIALVPALGATLLMLWGRRPGMGAVLLGILLGLVAVSAFLVVDLARPPEARTHLARLFEDFSQRGIGVLWDTIRRKAGSNLDVFRSSVYTLFVPPALGVMALLLRRPRGRWNRLAHALPYLRAALAGGLLLAVLGFAVNDSGIVIPAVVLSFLVPLTLLVHLLLDAEAGDDGAR